MTDQDKLIFELTEKVMERQIHIFSELRSEALTLSEFDILIIGFLIGVRLVGLSVLVVADFSSVLDLLLVSFGFTMVLIVGFGRHVQSVPDLKTLHVIAKSGAMSYESLLAKLDLAMRKVASDVEKRNSRMAALLGLSWLFLIFALIDFIYLYVTFIV